MEIMFRAKGEGRTEMPPKPSIHPGGENFLRSIFRRSLAVLTR